jgi:hypothetical protein
MTDTRGAVDETAPYAEAKIVTPRNGSGFQDGCEDAALSVSDWRCATE